MRFLLAAALLLQDSAFDDLRSDDVAVRDAASRRLRALGREAVPRLREARARETDPEARARLSDALAFLLPVRAELSVRNPRLRLGERLDWNARLVNDRDAPVVLALARRGSDRYAQLPLVDVELELPDGRLRSGRDFQYEGTGRIEEVGTELFVEVSPKGVLVPFKPERERILWIERWAPEMPGRHRVRFVYDSSPRRWGAWTEFHPPELEALLPGEKALAASQVEDPSPEVAARFRLLHHERLVSPWVELAVAP